MVDTYTCAQCGGTFEKGWSDEESAAEATAIWGEIDDPVAVCDDCWQVIRPDRVPTGDAFRALWERAREDWMAHTGRTLPDPVIGESDR